MFLKSKRRNHRAVNGEGWSSKLPKVSNWKKTKLGIDFLAQKPKWAWFLGSLISSNLGLHWHFGGIWIIAKFWPARPTCKVCMHASTHAYICPRRLSLDFTLDQTWSGPDRCHGGGGVQPPHGTWCYLNSCSSFLPVMWCKSIYK